MHELNTTGLSFPMSVRDVPNFENLNPNISVSVSVFEERQLIPLYLSPHRNRQHTIHLLLSSDGNTQHYTLIRNLSRLVSGRTIQNCQFLHYSPRKAPPVASPPIDRWIRFDKLMPKSYHDNISKTPIKLKFEAQPRTKWC